MNLHLRLLAGPGYFIAVLLGLGAYSLIAGYGFGFTACPFHAATGMPCPGCGLTRSVLALLDGNVKSALTWNALGLMGLIFAMGLWTRWALRRIRGEDVPIVEFKLWHAIALGLIVFVWGVFRLTPWGAAFFTG